MYLLCVCQNIIVSTELRLIKNRIILWHIENDDKLPVCMDIFALQRDGTGGWAPILDF